MVAVLLPCYEHIVSCINWEGIPGNCYCYSVYVLQKCMVEIVNCGCNTYGPSFLYYTVVMLIVSCVLCTPYTNIINT